VPWIGPPISVSKEAIWTQLIFIGPFAPSDYGRSRNTEREAHGGGLEDALRTLQRDSLVLEEEPGPQDCGGKHFAVKVDLVAEERECREPDEPISVVASHGQILHP
jgi:hypothetical protein